MAEPPNGGAPRPLERFSARWIGVLAAFLVFLAGQLTNENVAEVTWVLTATGIAGLAAAVPTWLAFLPPQAYRRRFDDRALFVR